MYDDGLDDHPDLISLKLSAQDRREARAIARRSKARRAPRGPSFLRWHRTAVVAVLVLVALVAASTLVRL
jgi:hypothetical protein